MFLAVSIEQQQGAFTATALGVPGVRATAATRDEAVAAVRGEVAVLMATGKLVMLDVEPKGPLAVTGKYRDDPAWQESWEASTTEAYRLRDEEKAREFPE